MQVSGSAARESGPGRAGRLHQGQAPRRAQQIRLAHLPVPPPQQADPHTARVAAWQTASRDDEQLPFGVSYIPELCILWRSWELCEIKYHCNAADFPAAHHLQAGILNILLCVS